MRVYSKDRSCAILPCTVQSRSLTAPSGILMSSVESVPYGMYARTISTIFPPSTRTVVFRGLK